MARITVSPFKEGRLESVFARSSDVGELYPKCEVRFGSKAEVEPPLPLVRSSLNSGHHGPRLRSPESAITGSQLISRSLVGAPFLAKASWLYKQDAREVHRS
jgi:hypothetical protein